MLSLAGCLKQIYKFSKRTQHKLLIFKCFHFFSAILYVAKVPYTSFKLVYIATVVIAKLILNSFIYSMRNFFCYK